ncbi:MAG TPA: hypothetical protein VJL07_02355 [Dehalococcoidia bacterium]|nr:hypothetical protein [Dehalococcoidia bacterium]
MLAEPVAEPKTLGSPSNAYYAYTSSDEDIDLASGASDREDRDEAKLTLEKLLDHASGVCSNCGAKNANLFWVPADRFKGKWTDFDLSSIARTDEPGLPVCAACATEEVTDAIQVEQLRLDELWAPVDGTVLMFSGEA